MVGQDAEEENIRNLKRVSSKQLIYAVDVWAGVCCHVNQYPDQLKQKMAQWEKDNKLINTPEGDVRPSKWGKTIQAGSWDLRDPKRGLTFRLSEDLLSDLATLRATNQRAQDGQQEWLDGVRAELSMIARHPKEYAAMVDEDASERITHVAHELQQARLGALSTVQTTAQGQGYHEWRAEQEQRLARWRDLRQEINEDRDGFVERKKQALERAESEHGPLIDETARLLWEMDSRRRPPGTPGPAVVPPGPRLQPSRLQPEPAPQVNLGASSVEAPARQRSTFRRLISPKPTSPRPTASSDELPTLRKVR
jgi:hypothetical protein